MKDLLQTADSKHYAVGLGDRAFAVVQHADEDRPPIVLSLLPPSEKSTTKKNQEHESADDESTAAASVIQAVAIGLLSSNMIWCAVARADKSLALYRIDSTTDSSSISPCMVHNTAKRVSCLSFASMPSSSITSQLDMIVAGDLAGDATAYPLEASAEGPSSSHRRCRLLLGHTASMLTALRIVKDLSNNNQQQYILTADRDEKIRVSQFPQTHMVEGFLLGHTAFVSGLDASSSSRCVTCGGDGKVRLWDYRQCQELDVWESSLDDHVPTRVAMSPDGTTVAVLYHESPKMDVLSIQNNNRKLELQKSVTFARTEPLTARFLTNELILVIGGGDEMITCHCLTGEEEEEEDTTLAPVQALQDAVKAIKIEMPRSILETDNSGRIILEKEPHVPNQDGKSWNRAERIMIAKKASSRRKRRKKGLDVDEVPAQGERMIDEGNQQQHEEEYEDDSS